MTKDTRHGRLTLFRAAALQGLLANPSHGRDGSAYLAEEACDCADALMSEADRRDDAERKAQR